MERFCTNCGTPLAEDSIFCSECGTKYDAPADEPLNNFVAAAAAGLSAPSAPAPAEKPAPQPSAHNFQKEPPQENFSSHSNELGSVTSLGATRSPEVKTASYFWLMLLFAIPVIGLIALLILAFASKNKNIKHWCRAILIWILVGFILLAVSMLVCWILAKSTGFTLDSIDWQAIKNALGL